jgi:radical SAM superfamily enzyme YgiQ (UPF0313 family)
MKILLVSPNTLTVPYPVYPLGLDYVAGSVPPGHEVRIADLNVLSFAELDRLAAHFQPDIIGLSCRNIDNTEAGESRYFINEYRELVLLLRAACGAVVVCGGSGFTIMPEQILAALDADYGVIGEGERFGLLVNALAHGLDPAAIPGVITAASTVGTWTPAPWDGPIVRNFKNHAAVSRYYLDKGGMLNLQSKRGCCFACIYCPYPDIEGRKHRLVAPEEVAGTALSLEAAGARYFFITDSAFNSDINHSLAVAKAFKAAGVSIPWGGFFAPVRLPADYFAIMADAGCSHVEFGTESLADSVLKSYRKPFTVADVFAAHGRALDAGLHVAHYFLMGGPGESAATVTESLDNIDRLDRTVLFFFIGIRIYPRTALCDIALKEGKITGSTNLLEPVFYEADGIDRRTVEAMVTARVGKRINCVVGSGGTAGAATVGRMHARGYTGPLWEYLIR